MKLRYNWFLVLIALVPIRHYAQAFPSNSNGARSLYLSSLVCPADLSVLASDNRLASSKEDKEASLRKATATHAMVQRSWLSSMIIPGLGQVYNKHYWKVPCFYLGFVLLGLKIYREHNEMNKYKRDKLVSNRYSGTHRYSGLSQPPNLLSNESYIKRRIDECKRARNLFILIVSAWYLVNILDAYAGAHSRTVDFANDIGETLSSVKPAMPAVTSMMSTSTIAAPLVSFSFPIYRS